jgi:hypothetical protein
LPDEPPERPHGLVETLRKQMQEMGLKRSERGERSTYTPLSFKTEYPVSVYSVHLSDLYEIVQGKTGYFVAC